MTLQEYVIQRRLTGRQAAREAGIAYESFRLYVIGARIPRPATMRKIVLWAGGAVQPNDFYTTPTPGAMSAAAHS